MHTYIFNLFYSFKEKLSNKANWQKQELQKLNENCILLDFINGNTQITISLRINTQLCAELFDIKNNNDLNFAVLHPFVLVLQRTSFFSEYFL